MNAKSPTVLTTPDRTQRRALRTRQRLLDAALSCFTDKGIDATTIEDVTERADVGKGTFYRHFSGKEAVLLALVEMAVDHLIAHLGEPVPTAGLEQTLETLVQGHSKFFAERPTEFVLLFQGRVLLKLQRDLGEDLEQPYLRYLEEIGRRIAPLTAHPVKPERIRRFSCAVAGFVSGFLSFAMIGMEEASVESSLAPLRRAFVAAASTFLGKSEGPTAGQAPAAASESGEPEMIDRISEGLSTSEDEPPSSPGSVEQDSTDEPPGPLLAGHERWDDWRWQMKNRIRTVAQLEKCMPALRQEAGLREVAEKYPLAITPYYASLIQTPDESDPVFQMSVPQMREFYNPPFLLDDPLEEHEDMPVPGLVHRYPDRALLMATTTCAMYCRHCTRKRVAGTRETSISAERLHQAIRYLREHPEIHDVIVSGGDPLTMSDTQIERVLVALRRVPSVEIIRFGTRTAVTLPMRITPQLVAMMRRYHPIFVNTHFNHPNELTAEAAEACARLVDGGIVMGNQSVLLRGINDHPQVMEQLCRGLLRMRVRPYYLYQCDLVRGVEHFRTPLSRGLEIMEYLRGRLSGLAIPSFVVDAPHGGGKLPLLPNYIVSMSPTHTVLRNFEGMMVAYPEPDPATSASPPTSGPSVGAGVWELVSGQTSAIVPADLARWQRRDHSVRADAE